MVHKENLTNYHVSPILRLTTQEGCKATVFFFLNYPDMKDHCFLWYTKSLHVLATLRPLFITTLIGEANAFTDATIFIASLVGESTIFIVLQFK